MGWDSIAVDRWGNNYQLWSTNAEVQGKEITDKYMVPANVDAIIELCSGGAPDFDEDITIDGDLSITGTLSVGENADITGDLTAHDATINHELEVSKSVNIGLEDGDEMVINGGFDTDLTGWTNVSVTQSAGVASIPYEGKLSQPIAFLEAITYRISYVVTASVLGAEAPSGPGISLIGAINTEFIAADSFEDVLTGDDFRAETVTGSYDFIFTPYQDYSYFSILNDTVGSTMTIDNISIRPATYYVYGYTITPNGNLPYDSQSWNLISEGANTELYSPGTSSTNGTVSVTCNEESAADVCGIFHFIDYISPRTRLTKDKTYLIKYTLHNSSGAAAESEVYVGFTDGLGEYLWTSGVQRFTGGSTSTDHEFTVVCDDTVYDYISFSNQYVDNTLTISNLSVVQQTEYDGDLTVGGDATFNGSLVLPHSVSVPSDPIEGQMYVDTNLDGLYVYSESSWRTIATWHI